MNDTIQFILSLSIVFAAILGVVRYRVIDPSYYPFLYYTWIVVGIELTMRILMVNGMRDTFSTVLNSYAYVEFALFTWLFHNWRLFNGSRKVFYGLLIVFFIAWFLITFILRHYDQPNFYFRILFSFALIFYSVSMFNRLVVHVRGNIFKDSKFLICVGIIIFYSFFIVVCASSSVFRGGTSKIFFRNLQAINVYSNLLVNILYAVAIIWMPRKKIFITVF